MIGSLQRACAASLGARVAAFSLVAVAVGAACLLVGLLAGQRQVALGALAAGWLFFAGLAAAGVAFSAAVRCSYGRWAASTLPAAEATAGFFPAAVVLLAVLVLAAPAWIPGADLAGWGSWASRAARDLVAAFLLLAAARYYLRIAAAGDARPSRAAVVYLVLYVGTLSLWAVDLVMGLHEWAPSTVIPPFYFMSAFLAAIAWAALVFSGGEAEEAATTRHDLGKLLFAFVVLWGYLLWSAYLPVWYANLPDETGQLVARWAGGWKVVTLTVLATVLAFPFLFLLPERIKRGRRTLQVAATSILVGLVANSFLLVLPSLPPAPGPAAALLAVGIVAGTAGLFTLTVGAKLGSAPARGAYAAATERATTSRW